MEAVLAQRHSVKGRFYGPGRVDVSEEVHATLTRRGAFVHPLAEYPALILAGYLSLDEVRGLSDETLLKIDGIGPATIRKLRGEEEKPVKPKFIGEKADGAQKQDQAADTRDTKGA